MISPREDQENKDIQNKTVYHYQDIGWISNKLTPHFKLFFFHFKF